MARDLASNPILPDGNGEVTIPDAPGLGIEVNVQAMREYLVDVQIVVRGKMLFESTSLV